MDLSSGQMDSPSNVRSVAGPSRNRLQARQHRNSSSKPYNRNNFVSDSPARNNQVDSAISSPTSSFRSAKSRLAGKITSDQAQGISSYGAAGGLLSGLREAIFSRPLSWIQGAATKASSVSLPSHAQITAAQRLAASVMGSQSKNDIESQADSNDMRKKPPPRSSSHVTPARNTSRLGPSRLATTSTDTPARSPSPARSATSAAIQSLGRQRLSVGPSPASPIFGGSMLGTPGYRRGASLRPEESSFHSVTSMAASQSNPSYAFGYGSEKRIAGINSTNSAYNFSMPSPSSASTSYNRLPSKSPFAMARPTYGTSSTTGSVLGLDRSPRAGGMRALASPSRSRPASVIVGENLSYRGGSVAESRMSNTSLTPKRREWSTLKLAPPRLERSEGEEMMQAYQQSRNGADVSQTALFNGDMTGSDVLMIEFDAGPSSISRIDLLQETSSMKRGASMSLDGDDHMSEGTPRKRAKQMVWDADYGFVSKEELRGKRPAPPTAQNEAERLLNALEGMRAPVNGFGTNRSTPLRQSMSVPIPLAVSERSEKGSDVRQGRVKEISKTVSPYSRALKQRQQLSKAHQAERGESLNARLRRQTPRGETEKIRSDDGGEDEEERGSNVSMHEDESESADASGEEEEPVEEEEEEIIEPPRRKMGQLESVTEKSRVLRSGKILLPSPPKKTPSSMPAKVVSPKQSEKVVKPMSRARLEISANATSAANRDRMINRDERASKITNGFKVLNDMPAERSKSSLRQGVDKMHRTHAKSGRVGIDDEDEEDDEDLPSAEELKKIKLPTNLFPQGFIFSGSTSPSSNGSMTPAREPLASLSDNPTPKALPAPEDDPEKQSVVTKANESNQGSSLLDRLGGFAQPSNETSKPAVPTFSFTAPSSTSTSSVSATSESAAPITTPAFTFSPAAPKVNTGPSDFFSASSSASNTGTTPSPSANNDGPVPNFFASSLAKSTSDQGADKTSKPFTFGQPATSKSDSEKSASNSAPIFSFGSATPGPNPASQSQTSSSPAVHASQGQEVQNKPAATGGFTFGPASSSSNSNGATPTFTGFGQKPGEASSEQKQTTPSFSGFGNSSTSQAAETTPNPTQTFAFGASTAPASSPSPFGGFGETSKKRSADEDEDRPGKKVNGFASSTTPFSFGSNVASTAPTSTSTSTGFNFTAPNKANEKSAESSKPAFSFGASTPLQASSNGTTDTKPAAPSTPASSFSFGSGNAMIDSASKGSMEMMDTSPSSSTLISGSANPSLAFGASSSKPFSFGNNGEITGNSASAPSTSQGGFSFGSSTPSKSNGPTPFTFGSTNNGASNASSTNLFGQPPASLQPNNLFGNASATQNGGFNNGTIASSSMVASNSQPGSSTAFGFGNSNTNSTTSNSVSGFGGFGQSQGQVTTPGKPAFTFGNTTPANTNTNTPVANNSSFSFNMPAAPSNVGSNSGFMSVNNNNAAGSPAPFVFGSGANTSSPAQTNQAVPGGGFSFNMSAPASPQTPAGGGNLFNLGAAPSAPASGNRPVRGMPSRRRR